MRCPVCFEPMQETTVRKMAVERCSGCQGLWADRFALGSALAVGNEGPQTLVVEASKLPAGEATCPGCGVSLDPMEIDGHRVDACGVCSCLWISERALCQLWLERVASGAQDTVQDVGSLLLEMLFGAGDRKYR